MVSSSLSKEDTIKLNHIIESIEGDQYSFIFLEPVDYIGLGLTDYLDVVKKPMDLGTIKKKLKKGEYSVSQEAIDDLNLIWSNCKLYNLNGSDIYLTAVHMEKICKKLLEKNFKEKKPAVAKKNISKSAVGQIEKGTEGNGDNGNTIQGQGSVADEYENFEDDPTAILPFKDRCYLCERIKRLTNDGLSSLVRLIEKELPSAVSSSDPDKLEIKLTTIDRKFFQQINQLIDTYLKVKETNQENLILKKSGLM
mmetsp:Transcript_85/g.73  ORF Transcript_85/g.73 Transcript_85/m.73 type:complete len:252 (+) Transcript_85:10-765(+)